MNFILAFVLGLSASHARALDSDALQSSLAVLRNHVHFVDTSPEGRKVDNGFEYMAYGTGFAVSMLFAGGNNLPKPLAIAMVVGITGGLMVAAYGGVSYVTGKLIKATVPRPAPGLKPAREYMSAYGLNEFMRLDPREQFQIAAGEPQFAEMIIKLARSFEVAKRYRMLTEPDPYR